MFTASSVRSQSIPKIDCNNAQTQSAMNICAAQQARTAELKLNLVYQRAISKFKGTPNEKQLVTAQRAWIQFRDASCTFERDRFKGGTIAPLMYSSCLTELTQQRTQALQRYLSE
ncbi:hypothetical protein LEP3755_61290 [Leptolyngbya sp. NIES-3755]|nr:hypothetical protein LEP3755_61290 [Leptolyngbya sp. NIES-3755]